MSYLDWIGPAVLPSLIISAVGLSSLLIFRRAPSSARHLTLASSFVALGVSTMAAWVKLPQAQVVGVSRVERVAAHASNHADLRWMWLALVPVAFTAGKYLLGLACLKAASKRYRVREGQLAGCLVICPSARTAYVYGVLAPTVVLPESYLSLEPEALEAIIRHEEAHVKQGDVLLIPIVAVLQGLFWWNPLIHLLAHRWRIESERAADDAVLAMGVAPQLYARQLLDLAQGMAGRAPLAGSALIGRGRMRNRILAVLNPNIRRKPMNNKKKWISVAACAGIALSLSVVAQARWSAAKLGAPAHQTGVQKAVSADTYMVQGVPIDGEGEWTTIRDGAGEPTTVPDRAGEWTTVPDGAKPTTFTATDAKGQAFKGKATGTGEVYDVQGYPLNPTTAQGSATRKPN